MADKITKDFRKGNFSCNLENELPNKSDFMDAHRGKYNGDLETLWGEIGKAKTKFKNSAKGKKAVAEKKDADKEEKEGDKS